MKLRALILGTAALAGTLLLAGPGFAEPNYYNTNPTPEERAQIVVTAGCCVPPEAFNGSLPASRSSPPRQSRAAAL